MREQLPVLLAALAVLLVGALGYQLVFGQRQELRIEVLEVQGEVGRVDGVGAERAAQAGDTVALQERVVVGADGRAILGIGAGTTLALEPSSSIRVTGVEADGVRVELEEGRVQAKVSQGSPVLAVARGAQQVRLRDGAVQVGLDDQGVLSVEGRGGEAELEGFGATERLGPGERLVVDEDGVSAPIQVPEELLLQVAWPELVATREEELALVGRADPKVRVRASNGTVVIRGRAGPEGTFRLVVPLVEGRNRILVEVDDRLGRTRSSVHEVVRDTRAPSATQAEVVWQR